MTRVFEKFYRKSLKLLDNATGTRAEQNGNEEKERNGKKTKKRKKKENTEEKKAQKQSKR